MSIFVHYTTFCNLLNITVMIKRKFYSLKALLVTIGMIFSLSLYCQFAYISSYSGDYVSVVDIQTNWVVATIPVGDGPTAVSVSPDGTRVYVANSMSDDISVIDAATQTVIATIDVGYNPISILQNPKGNKIFVANRDSGSISVISTTSLKVIHTFYVGTEIYGMTLNPAESKLYVTQTNIWQVSVFSTSSYALLTTLPVGDFPIGITFSPDGYYLYVACYDSDELYVIRGSDHAILRRLVVPATPFDVAVSNDGSKIFVSHESLNIVSIWDAYNYSLIGTLNVGSAPQGLALNASGSLLYVVNYKSKNVTVISTYHLCVIGTIPVGNLPSAFGNFVSASAVLPVEMVDFDVRHEGADHLVSWKTLSEVDNEYFEIEHSQDGRVYTVLDKQMGRNSLDQIQEYRYIHKKPASGIHYYRIKQMDYNGIATLSEVRTLRASNSGIEIYPNPVSNQLNIIGLSNESEVEMKVFDIQGKLILSQKGTINELDIRSLKSGMYILTVDVNGDRVLKNRFVKQ